MKQKSDSSQFRKCKHKNIKWYSSGGSDSYPLPCCVECGAIIVKREENMLKKRKLTSEEEHFRAVLRVKEDLEKHGAKVKLLKRYRGCFSVNERL